MARQAPLSMGFPRQEYWSGFSFPSPGDLPNPDIEPETPASPSLDGGFFTTEPPGNSLCIDIYLLKLCGHANKAIVHTIPQRTAVLTNASIITKVM